MITISHEGKSRKLDGKKRVILEIRGLSTDEKPEDILKCIYIDNGSVFIEIDTGDVFIYDLVSGEWYNVTNPAEPSDNSDETPDEPAEPSEPSEPSEETPQENVGE